MASDRRSPFPGMDPYLEQYWEDVHFRLIGNAADALFDQLPSGLIARVDQRVYVDEEGEPTSVRKPDVRVVESPVAWEQRPAQYAPGETAVPVLLEVEVDPVTERFIRNRSHDRESRSSCSRDYGQASDPAE